MTRSRSSRRWQFVWRPWPITVSLNRGVDEHGWSYVHLEWARQWFFNAPTAYTLRHPDPISRIPIWRWALNVGPLAIHRWNVEMTPHPGYRAP